METLPNVLAVLDAAGIPNISLKADPLPPYAVALDPFPSIILEA